MHRFPELWIPFFIFRIVRFHDRSNAGSSACSEAAAQDRQRRKDDQQETGGSKTGSIKKF